MGTRASWIVVLVASLVGALGPGALAAAPARAESPPPTISAAGANDWSCKPTAAHPRRS